MRAKGYLQNKQKGLASKKDLYEDLAHVQNIFTLLTVWLNPIRLKSKLGNWKHQMVRNWITYMWETMMPKDLALLIETKEIFVKLDKLELMENSAINAALNHLEDGHLDEELASLIKLNHNFFQIFVFHCD